MNDPVPNQGESDGAPVPAAQPTVEVQPAPQAVTSPEPVQGPQAPQSAPQASELPRSESAQVFKHRADPATPASPIVHATDLMKPVWGVPHPEQPVTNGAWESELERSSSTTGVDVNLMRQIAGKESSNNPYAKASTSSASGIFQITKGTWEDLRTRYGQLGLDNRLDAAQQARIAPYYMKEIQENLHRVLGRKPSSGESYLGWFLGPSDSALAVKASPSTPVGAIINPASIAANPAVFKNVQTIGDLYKWADQKMGGAGAEHPAPRIDLSPYLNLGPHSSKDGSDCVSACNFDPVRRGIGVQF